jgi:hypothetical protein
MFTGQDDRFREGVNLIIAGMALLPACADRN